MAVSIGAMFLGASAGLNKPWCSLSEIRYTWQWAGLPQPRQCGCSRRLSVCTGESEAIYTAKIKCFTFPTAVFLALSRAVSPAVKAESSTLTEALPIALEILPTAESAIPDMA